MATVPVDAEERPEPRVCALPTCGKVIQPGQLYDKDGPYHIGCARKARAAARTPTRNP